MKTNFINSILTLCVIVLSGLNLCRAQNQTTSSESQFLIKEQMKVLPGMQEEYLKTEALWKKVHQRRVSEGNMISWQLYRRIAPQGSNSPYDYMVVAAYKSAKDIDNMSTNMNWEYITKGMSVAEITLINDTEKTRKLVGSQWLKMLERVQPTGKYVEVNELTVPNGKGGEMEKMEKMMNPVFVELASAGKIAGWRFGEIIYSEGSSGGYFRVITTNSINDMLTWSDNKTIENAFKKVHPTTDFAATMKSFADMITFGQVDLLEKVDGTN